MGLSSAFIWLGLVICFACWYWRPRDHMDTTSDIHEQFDESRMRRMASEAEEDPAPFGLPAGASCEAEDSFGVGEAEAQ